MEDSRRTLASLQRRFKSLSQQQFTFVSSLDRCRRQNFESTKPISTVSQVQTYKDEVTDNATDKRIFAIFLSLVYDLDEFRRYLEKLTGKCVDPKLQNIFRIWKKCLHPRQDVSNVRARFPNDQINHLSCDEAKNHFGGIVSLVPFAMDCASEAVERMESSESSYDIVPPNHGDYDERSTPKFQTRIRPQSCKPGRTTFRSDTSWGGEGNRISTPTPIRPLSSSSSKRSASTISRVSSRASERPNSNKNRRPASAHPTSYVCQAVQTGDSIGAVHNSGISGKAVQTPNYLNSTLKPSLNWAHQTVSESEMRKLLKSRRHVLAKPGWKP